MLIALWNLFLICLNEKKNIQKYVSKLYFNAQLNIQDCLCITVTDD